MRPLTLQIEGLRSFRVNPEPIDFQGRDYLAIIGDTGAGKSSLLEAMGWVLYGSTSWSGQPNQELMNDTSAQLRVVLTFTVRGQRWRATRALRRRADGSVGPATAVLEQLADDDEVIESVDKVRAVEARVQELIGLTYEGFTRAVVLPQGQFARLLVSDDPTDRAKILKELWGVAELTAAKADVDTALADLIPLAARIDEALRADPEDPEAHLQQLQDAAHGARELARQERERADRAVTAAKALHDHQRTRDAATAALTALTVDDRWQATARTIAERDQELAGQQEALAAQRHQVQDELDRIPDDIDGLSAGEVASTESQLDRLPELLHDLQEARSTARTRQKEVAEAEEHTMSAETAAHIAAEASRTHYESRAPLAAAVNDARTIIGDARGLLDRWRHALEQLDAARLELSTAKEQHQQAERRLQSSKTTAQRASADREQARQVKEAADRVHAAIAAADGLAVGDDCTVCYRALPEGWSSPTDSRHAEATTAAVAADKQAVTAERELAKAEADVEAGQKRTDECDARSKVAEAQAAGHASDLVELLGRQPEVEQDDGTLLQPLQAVLDTTASALAAHEATGEQLRTDAQKAGEAAVRAAATRDASISTMQAALDTADRCRNGLRAVASSIGPALGIAVTIADDAVGGPEPDVSGIDEARRQLTERTATLAMRAQQRRELQDRARELSDHDAELSTARTADVTRPLADLARSLDGHCQQLKRTAGSLEADEPDLPSLIDLAPADGPSTVGVIGAATAGMRHLAELRLEESGTKLGDAERQLDDLRRDTGLTDDDVSSLVGTLAGHANSAEVDARITAKAAAAFAARMPAIAALRTAQADLATHELVLRDLSDALNPGAFPKWLTMRRSHDLLVHASGLLELMTGKRYSFAEVDDPEAPWKIVDNDTGLARTPASLSGGETFVASLSLALGMVEMMARSGGRLESLWLDEGFGALDRSNLDAAVDALSQVAARGRMVAVISHVRAVAEQVEHVLAVTRTTRGSRAHWLSPVERATLAEADVGESNDTIAAIAGLLD